MRFCFVPCFILIQSKLIHAFPTHHATFLDFNAQIRRTIQHNYFSTTVKKTTTKLHSSSIDSGGSEINGESDADKEDDNENYIWLSESELQLASKNTNEPFERIAALYPDVKYYNDESESSEPTYRLQKKNISKISQGQLRRTSSGPVLVQAQEVAETTIRWCREFVQRLDLCPWAKMSLQSQNAIRIKIIHQSMGLETMEQIIRESALELIDVTDRGDVDINVGITFVVAIRGEGGNVRARGDEEGFQFESFYDFCTDLEDRMFDEADEAAEKGDDVGILIGDEVTIAPFHPDWYFSTENNVNGKNGELRNPLDYEKKSPYPTISLVRTSVILQAGEEATSRIGIHNEKILNECGAKRLNEIYNEKVLGVECRDKPGDLIF